MKTVWLREMDCDHAPSYGVAIFSTREKAEASIPHVTAWTFYGHRAWADASRTSWGDCWVIREMDVDPGPEDADD